MEKSYAKTISRSQDFEEERMSRRVVLPVVTVTVLMLLGAAATLVASTARAQVMDFGKIDAFESMGSGTQRGAATPKTLIDDGEKHMVVFTILEADTETKIYWKPVDGSPDEKTTMMAGPGVQVFQTAGDFKIEAVGDTDHTVKYGYMVFRLR